jgi:hypothetical protein
LAAPGEPTHEDAQSLQIDSSGERATSIFPSEGAALAPGKEVTPQLLPAADNAEPQTAKMLSQFLTEGQDPDAVKVVVSKVRQMLTSNEDILYVAIQNLSRVKSLIEQSHDSIILTNKRLIVYKPKILGGVSFEDHSWRQLSDPHIDEGSSTSKLTLKTTRGDTLTFRDLTKSQARRLYSHSKDMEEKHEVRVPIAQQTPPSQTNPSTAPVQRVQSVVAPARRVMAASQQVSDQQLLQEFIAAKTAKGWQVIALTESSVQIKKPKQWNRYWLIIGVLTSPLVVGLFILPIEVFDYVFFRKDQIFYVTAAGLRAGTIYG